MLTDCSNPSAKMAKIKEIKERYNQSVILNPKLKLENSMDTVVSKLMTVDTDLIQSLRADVAEAGSFTNIYTYGLFSFGGLYPGMLARDTSRKEWMPVFTGSKAFWRLIKNHCAERLRTSSKALTLQEAVLFCKRNLS